VEEFRGDLTVGFVVFSSDGEPVGEIINLGYHDSDFDWNNEQKIKAKMFKKKRIQNYHTQYYVNGTICNVINHKRDSEVRVSFKIVL